MAPGSPAPAPLAFPDTLLVDLLDVSLTGVNVLRPLSDPDGEITDFTIEYLNPAGQRITGLPAQPGGTLLTRFPHTTSAGILAYYRRAYTDGDTDVHEVYYQADGLDNYFRLAARRTGDWLVVSFTDTAGQDRSAAEQALRQSQATEQAARAEAEQQRTQAEAARRDAEAQRQRLHDFMSAAPGVVLSLVGPQHVIEFANEGFRQQFGVPDPVGRPYLDALPEATDQSDSEYRTTDLYDHIYRTGEPYYAAEAPYYVDPTHSGQGELRYFNFAVQAVRDGHGRIAGVQAYAFDVTDVVRARQQLEQLNQELEARVQARTQEAEAASADAEEQRSRLERLFQQAPAHINLYAGPHHVWTLVHPATAAKLGHRLLLGRPRREALPELPEEQHALLDHVYRTGDTLKELESLRRLDLHNDGQLHDQYFDFTYQPLFDGAGRIDGVMSFGVDVTDRVQVRQRADALQAEVLTAAQHQTEARTLVFQVFEETPACIALLRGPAHRFEYINRAYQDLFPGRELVGHALAEALPDAAAQGFLDLLDGVYRTGDTFFGNELPLAIAQPDGRPPRQAYFTFTYQAYYEQGQVKGVSIFAFDVSEQVLARQQREAERQQLNTLFMEAPAPIVILDGPDLAYQLVNPAYQRIFPGRALLGKPVLDALPEIAGTPIYASLRGVYETGETLVAQEMPLQLARHDDGPLEEMFFTFTYQARRNAQGAVDGVLVFAHEVTDQVQARRVVEEGGAQAVALAAELAESNQQLTRTNVDLDNFIYTASHDLKAPISNIEGLLYVLQEELPPAVKQQAHVGPTLTRMLDAVERFKRTIDHLTEVSKLQKENSPAEVAVDLAAVIEDVRHDLLPVLQAAGAKLVVDVPDFPPIHFAEKNLRSIVYNLLSNAVKYHSPDRAPRVDVRAHVRAGHTVLEVHDNGLGIAAAHLPKLYGMFQRFHDHVDGTGIGLYMVKRMVENAGGRMEVHSQLGAGTTFFVHLPHAAA